MSKDRQTPAPAGGREPSGSAAPTSAASERLDRSIKLRDRILYRAHRINRLGSSHSNSARALAKDSLRLLTLLDEAGLEVEDPRDGR